MVPAAHCSCPRLGPGRRGALRPAPGGHGLGFLAFLGVFLLAQFTGLVSHVPGGLGVVETTWWCCSALIAPSALLGSLIAYRVVYYLLPFGLVVLCRRHEAPLRPEGARRGARVGGWVPGLVPQVLSGAVFLTGAILLVSGATPPVPSRLAWLGTVAARRDRAQPLRRQSGRRRPAGAGVGALAPSRRGLRLTVALLAVGIGASLLKGADWEEATALAIVSRPRCLPGGTSTAAAIGGRAARGRLDVAILAVVGASFWLGCSRTSTSSTPTSSGGGSRSMRRAAFLRATLVRGGAGRGGPRAAAAPRAARTPLPATADLERARRSSEVAGRLGQPRAARRQGAALRGERPGHF